MYKLFYIYIITFFYINLITCYSKKHNKHTSSNASEISKETRICNGTSLGQFSMCTTGNSSVGFDPSENPRKDDNN